ncbi:MAG: tRNA (N6-threonylcarbamoyladenosine(37)-N6)-methyltransferase TrmO [Clostridia bacterium]|nr:tRNA (N6-threonylcarbamoyladenosine(37)-N6)-methyltransferase TrmO [Clostridia bacterium]
MKEKIIRPIGHIQNDFKEKFGIPRQSGKAAHLLSRVVFYPPYNEKEAFRALEGFSHLWLLFDFSKAQTDGFSPTVRPPRLGGNARVGVFASRSPFRPNGLGLSVVKLERVEFCDQGAALIVSGADLLDGTPIFDVKPYLPHADCIETAVGGYADAHADDCLQVDFPPSLLEKIPHEKRAGLIECLSQDPRPSYQDDPLREYGMRFADFNIRFRVREQTLFVIAVD